VPLLVACRVAEPRVALSCPALHFGRVLVGASAQATLELVNDEALPLAFEFAMPKAPGSPAASTSKRALAPQQAFCCGGTAEVVRSCTLYESIFT
jgi:hypothetical protein